MTTTPDADPDPRKAALAELEADTLAFVLANPSTPALGGITAGFAEDPLGIPAA